MIEELTVRTFKSLDDVTVPLGQVNVFIGANGAGKTNLLEALGILSAAAGGKVDEQHLLARGVEPVSRRSTSPPFGRDPASGFLRVCFSRQQERTDLAMRCRSTIRSSNLQRPGGSRQSCGKDRGRGSSAAGLATQKRTMN